MPLRSLVHAPQAPRAPRALVVALALAACTDAEPTATTPPTLAPARASLAVSAPTASPALAVAPASVTITQGRNVPFGAVVLDPLDARQASARIAWSSSNPAVATVSSAGLVRGVGPGTVTITASAMERRLVATSAVTVVARPKCERAAPYPANRSGTLAPVPPGYEDSPLFFRAVMRDDPDPCHRYTYRVTGLPVSGRLYQVAEDGTPQLDAAFVLGANVSNSEGWLAFYPNTGFFGSDSFRYESRDAAGVFLGFQVPLEIDVLPVNDPPIAFAGTHVGDNDVRITNVLLQVRDVDNLPSQTQNCVAELPRNGDLYWSSVSPANLVAKGDCRSIASLRYASRVEGVFGCGYTVQSPGTYPRTDGFRWYATDGIAISDTVTGTISIDYVNQPPVYRGPASVSTTEETPVTFTPSGFDPDGNVMAFTVDAPPRHGALWVVSVSDTHQVTTFPSLFFVGTTLQYVPDVDFDTRTQTDDIPLELSDGSPGACINTVRFDVAAVNDPATIVAPDRIGALVGLGGIPTPTTFNGVGVSDDARPGDLLAVTLRAQGPAAAGVAFADPTGFTWQRVSALEVRFVGTLASINTLLSRGLTWTPNASGANYGELAIIVDDQGNGGPGGPRVATRIVAVDVSTESEGGLEGIRDGAQARARPSARATTRRPPPAPDDR